MKNLKEYYNMKYKIGVTLYCVKDFHMNNNVCEYTKGKKYIINGYEDGIFYNIIDNSDDKHWMSEKDVSTYFVTRYDKLKRIMRYD